MKLDKTTTSIRVLAVDDEELNNDLVRRTLRTMANVTVVTATSGQEALEVVGRLPVDVLLVDQSMPGMTGVEFLEKASVAAPRAVGVMVTGFPELREVMQALERGIATQIVVKPWTPAQLISAVERAVAVREIQGVTRRLEQYKSGRDK